MSGLCGNISSERRAYGRRAGPLAAADARIAASCAASMRTGEPRARLADLRRTPAIRYRTGFCGRTAAGSPAARLRARLLTMERRRGELSRRSVQMHDKAVGRA